MFRHPNALKLQPGEWVAFNEGTESDSFFTCSGLVVRAEEYDVVIRLQTPAIRKGWLVKVGYIKVLRSAPPPDPDCTACNGRGKKPCATCRGTGVRRGTLQCYACNGLQVTADDCEACDGKGKVPFKLALGKQ